MRTNLVAVLTVVFLCGGIPVTVAEDTPEIEEVVVTAQKREQVISDVPSSLQAFSGESLEEAGHSDLTVFLREIPSATIGNNVGGGAFNVIHMRGSGGLGQTGDGAVAYYLDEVPFGILNFQFSPVSNMFDLARIESLRGPQGTTWGQGSMGGTIRYIVNSPDLSKFDLKLQGSYGDVEGGDASYKLNAAINIPVVKDVFAVRIAGGQERRGGYAEAPDVTSDNLNKETLDNYRIKALWQATDRLDVSALIWRMETDMDYSNALSTVEPPVLPPTGGEMGFMGGESDVYSLTFDYAAGSFDVVTTTSFLDHDVPLLIAFVNPSAGPIRADQRYETETLAQEIRLVSTGEGPFNWLVGGYYSDTDQTHRQDQRFQNPFIQSFVGVDAVSDVNSEVLAVFGEISYELFDGTLVPLFGLRYFEDDRDLVSNSIRASGIGPTSLPFGTCDPAVLALFGLTCEVALPEFIFDDTFDSINPRFNLSYFPNETSMYYINIAKGFRSGTIQPLAAVQAAAFIGVNTTQALDDDSVISYEIGAKWELLDRRLAIELAMYRAKYEDAQVLFGTPVGVPASASAGDYEADGVEFSVRFSPVPGLTLAAVFSGVSSEWTGVDPEVALAVAGIGDGDDVPYIPENDWNLSIDYTGAIGDTGLTHFEHISYAQRQDQFDYSLNQSDDVDDLNVRIGVAGSRWQVSLYANNVTGERNMALSLGSTVYSQRPREIGINFQFELD